MRGMRCASSSHTMRRAELDFSAERIADPGVGKLILSIDAGGIDPQQHFNRVACAAGDCRRRDSCVEPQRNGRMPQVIGPGGQR